MKAQTSLYLIISMLLIAVLGVYLVLKDKSAADDLMEQSKIASAEQIPLYLQSANECLESSFKESFVLHGFDESALEESISTNFISCLDDIDIQSVTVVIESEDIITDIGIHEKIIIVEVILPSQITSYSGTTSLDAYTYQFSTISYENLPSSGNSADIDSIIRSSEGYATLYISKGTEIGSSPLRVIIETIEKPDLSFLYGNFAYRLSPEGEASKDFVLEILYEDSWVSGSETALKIAWFDPVRKEWVGMPTIVDTEKNSLKIITRKLGLYSITTASGTMPIYDGEDSRLIFDDEENDFVDSREDAPSTLAGANNYNPYNPFGLGDVDYGQQQYSPGTVISGNLGGGSTDVLSVKDIPQGMIAVETTGNPTLEVTKTSGGELIVSGAGDYSIEFVPEVSGDVFIELPYATGKDVSKCYDDPDYPNAAGGYVHLGTDFNTVSLVSAACSGTIIDVWSDRDLKILDDCEEFYRGAPLAEPVVYSNGGSDINDIFTGYGYGVVIQCDGSAWDKAVQIVYAHLNPDPGSFLIMKEGNAAGTGFELVDRKLCLGTHIDQGIYFAEAGSSGSSYGPHLHFEVRVGEPGENGVIPRRFAINPVIMGNLLSAEFQESLLKGSNSGSCDKPVYYVAGQDNSFFS